MGFNCWLLQQLDISRNTLIYNTHRKYRRRKKCILLPNSFTKCHQKEFSHLFLHYLDKVHQPRRRPKDNPLDNPVYWTYTLLKEIDINTISKSNRLETIGEEDKDRKLLP